MVSRTACSEDKLEFEIQFAWDGDNPGFDKFQVGIRCFAAWEFERNKRERRVQAAVVASPWRIPTTWTARRTRSLYSPAKQAIPSSANRRLTRSGSNVPHRQAPAFTRRRAAANATHHCVRRATWKQRGRMGS